MIGHVLLRTLIGGPFVGHGTQKLFGWFGGHGPEGTGQFFESLGLRPGTLAAGVGSSLVASEMARQPETRPPERVVERAEQPVVPAAETRVSQSA